MSRRLTSLSRRELLRAAGATGLALPFFGAFANPSRAAALSTPKRFLVVTHRQGTVMNQWAPTGTETNFTLSPILQPLVDFQDRMVVIAGLDNMISAFNSAGNGHENAELTLMTAMPFQDQTASVLQPGGPSLEQVLADRISTTTPFSRLDFGIGGGTSGGGLSSQSVFAHGAGLPVTTTNDPDRAFASLFGGATLSQEELQALRARRGSVLDAVKQSFDALRYRLPGDDQIRLDAHLENLRELETRVTSDAATACAPPVLSFPSGYDYGFDDDVTTPAQIELMVEALACDQSRVATMSFLSGHDPTFPWLDVGGAAVVPTDRYDNWHAMVHDGREEPGLVTGFTWYAEMVAELLRALENKVDVDGDNLLDTTCVMWISEFGNGAGHNQRKIPVVLFGNVGPLGGGRYLDHMIGGPDGNYDVSDHSTNQLFVSLLQHFGQTDTSFGFVDPSLPSGPLPGLL